MKFGAKIKQLRCDSGMTQEELAEKLYVSRTAVSKWETDRGFPAIDSLKMISELFDVSIDELISDGDIETKRALDSRREKRLYLLAIGMLAAATAFTLLAYFLKITYLNICGTAAAVLYVVFAFLSRPRYKRIGIKRLILPYIISRAVVLLFVIGLIVTAIISARG